MSPSSVRRSAASGVALVVAVAFFFIALSGEAYRDTSPPHLAATLFGSQAARLGDPLGISLHVVLRKIYSIVAFTIVGFMAELALPRSRRPALRMALLVAAYSGAIEYAQYRQGSVEGPWWNAVDVLCGAAGGWIAGRFTPVRWKPT